MAVTTTQRVDSREPVSDIPLPDRRADSVSSRDRSRGISLGAALGCLVAALGFFIGSRTIADNSFFTHLANGRLVLDGAGIPRVDPYSYTAVGEKVTVQSWLATIVYAWLDAEIGGWSIRAFNGAVTALVAAGIWRLSAALQSLIVRLALVGMTLGVGAFMWGPRPTMLGLLGLIALLLVHQKQLPLWTLLPVMWLWVNTHGSFPLGLAAIGAFGVGRLLDERSWPRHEAQVMMWALAGTLAGAIGPLGLEILWFPIHLMGRREALAGVGEWSPPAFDEPMGLILVGFVALHLVAAARGARWTHLLPGGLFLLASALAVRNLIPGVVVFVVVLAPFLEVSGGSLRSTARGVLPTGVALSSVLAVVFAAMVLPNQAAVSLENYPVAQIDWLEERDLIANPDVHVAHRDTVGNLLQVRYGADASVFIDDRFDFYPLDVLDDHRALFFGGDYREILDRHTVDVVLWEDETTLIRWLEEADEWLIADRSDGWAIVCRVGSPAADRCR